MRRILTIPIIFLLFISQVGYYFIYIIRQYQVKEQMKEELLTRMPEASLEIVVADDNTITWHEEGKEFSLHGQLYDVAKIKKVNGKMLLYCLNDKKEQQVLDDLSKAARSGNENNNDNRSKHTIKFQLTDYLADHHGSGSSMIPPPSEKHVCFTPAIRSCFLEITAPPPRA